MDLSAVAIVQASAGMPDLGAGLADRGHAGADGQLAGDEVRPARRATRLGVVVGEQHALFGQLVEVRRPAGHHAAMVGADVPQPMSSPMMTTMFGFLGVGGAGSAADELAADRRQDDARGQNVPDLLHDKVPLS